MIVVQPRAGIRPRAIKCLVWDLDHTLWDGVLLEDRHVRVSADAEQLVRTLDERGILQSIASRNDHTAAMARLTEAGLADYFLTPQITWNPKSASLRAIAEALDIGLDAMAFVDDDPFELDEVAAGVPDVLCVPAADVATLGARAEFTPAVVTPEAKARRLMYLAEARRRQAETDFAGPNEAFLATLGMECRIETARPEHLARAVELTNRTNQLNSTGYTYSRDELDQLCQSPTHWCLIVHLRDRYGDYGIVGLALVERARSWWTIKLFLMSCRVASRGLGSVVLSHVMTAAKQQQVALRAELVPNGRNRAMHVTYRLAGFGEVARMEPLIVLGHDLARIPDVPAYVHVIADEACAPVS